jgi:NhaP-type Na+/H+ or K+/H+ antiporter
LKDVVTIVLFSSISDLIINTKGSFDFDFLWYDPFKILGDFLLTVVVSVLIGIAFSIVITLIFKHFRFINHTKGIADVGLTFLVGLVAYLTS